MKTSYLKYSFSKFVFLYACILNLRSSVQPSSFRQACSRWFWYDMTSISKEPIVRKKNEQEKEMSKIAASVENIQIVKNTVPLQAARR